MAKRGEALVMLDRQSFLGLSLGALLLSSTLTVSPVLACAELRVLTASEAAYLVSVRKVILIGVRSVKGKVRDWDSQGSPGYQHS